MKSFRFILILLSAIIILLLSGHLLWKLQKETPMDLLIVNKTVSKISKNEVKSFNWVLNKNKIFKEEGEEYDFKHDYYGFYPKANNAQQFIKAYGLEDISYLQEKYDGIVYLDNEGLDFPDLKYPNLNHYGGFNNTDYLLLKEMIISDKLVIVEYNFFSEPTEELIRYNTELLLDVYSLHWKGKFFKNLNRNKISREIDPKWLDRYEEIYGTEWVFKGPGLVLCNPDQSRVIVLPQEEYMNDLPFIKTDPDNQNDFNLPDEACYSGWFQVVYEGDNEVISMLDLNLNDEGVNVLKNNGLEPYFPALIKVGGKHMFFLAGDFSKQKTFLPSSKLSIISDISLGICKRMTGNPRCFFQTYYVPLMSGILNGYSKNSDEKEGS